MNRIAKIAALLVALTAALSFSQESSSGTAETSIKYDTVIVHKIISDNVTLEALKDVENFYSKSFGDIQNSYNFFLVIVGIIVTIVCAILAFFGTFNWNENRKIKKILNEFENEKKLLDKNIKELYGEIEYTYFSLAISSFKMNDYEEHFRRLAEHFYILRKYKLKIENIDSLRIKYFDKWIEQYNGSYIEVAKVFLFELNKFIEYGEKTYPNNADAEAIYFANMKEVWEKLCDKFGGQDIILKAIKNFRYDN